MNMAEGPADPPRPEGPSYDSLMVASWVMARLYWVTDPWDPGDMGYIRNEWLQRAPPLPWPPTPGPPPPPGFLDRLRDRLENLR
jgi:hypothetical protein